jgi:hypothetical protein
LPVELTYNHNKEWQRSHIARVLSLAPSAYVEGSRETDRFRSDRRNRSVVAENSDIDVAVGPHFALLSAESGFEGANRLLALGKTPIAAEWGVTAFDWIPDADLYITPDKPSA